MNEWQKLALVVKQTGIPHQSLLRYIKRHSVHLQLKKEHKSYLLHKDSLPIIHQIRKHYEQGLTESEVEKELSMSGIPVVLEINEDTENGIGTVGNVLNEIQQTLHHMDEKQGKFNQELLERLESQQAYIERLESKLAEQQPAIEAPKRRRWQFWRN